VKVGEKKENILKALEMKSETQIMEFNTLLWTDENKMLINILQNFKKFQEFSEDWVNMTNIKILIELHQLEVISTTSSSVKVDPIGQTIGFLVHFSSFLRIFSGHETFKMNRL